jgi:hypothetical protein
MTFFVTSSKVTKFRSERKRKTEEGFKEGEDITVLKVNLYVLSNEKEWPIFMFYFLCIYLSLFPPNSKAGYLKCCEFN